MPDATLRAVKVLVAVLVLLLGTSGAHGAAAPSFQQIATGLTSPVYLTVAPGDPSTLYVVEQAGRIVAVRNGQIAGTFLDIRDRVKSGGEQGLLSVAFSPKYQQNHLFYIDYTDLNGDTHVAELSSANSNTRDLLFVKQPYPNHNGGQLEFDRAGYLYVGMGDGGTGPADPSPGDPQNHAQNLSSRLGKLLRIDPTRAGAKWQVVGLGLRNPWRFSFDRATGNLWIGDVGAGAYEEIDFRPKAKVATLANYGWPRYEGKVIYPTYGSQKKLLHQGTLVWPVWTYNHDFGTCAVTGGYVYRGSLVPSARGKYFFGDFCSGTLWYFTVGANGRASSNSPIINNTVPNLSSFGEDGHGELYAVSLDGSLYELR